MHPELVPPDSLKGHSEKRQSHLEDRIRRGQHAARQRPRGAAARRQGRAGADPRRGRKLQAGRRVQPARRVPRRGGLRPERGQLSRVAAGALYRLQPARPGAGARQGPVEEAGALPPRSVRRRSRCSRWDARSTRPPRLALPADRQEPERGRLHRHRAGLGGGDRREAGRARRLHPRAHRHRRRSPSNTSRAAKSMSACSATTAGACCRSGSCNSATWRRARCRSRPRRSSTTSNTSSATASSQGPAKGLSPPLQARIHSLAKRICRTLELDGYARIDFRLAARRHALFHRGQSQSGDRQDRGVRPARPSTTG